MPAAAAPLRLFSASLMPCHDIAITPFRHFTPLPPFRYYMCRHAAIAAAITLFAADILRFHASRLMLPLLRHILPCHIAMPCLLIHATLPLMPFSPPPLRLSPCH